MAARIVPLRLRVMRLILNIIFGGVIIVLAYYRTWENFGVGKNWRIWRIVVSSPIFYPPIISFRKYKIISVTEIQSALLLTIAKTLTQ